MEKTDKNNEFVVVPRTAEYSRDVRRKLQKSCPRGTSVVFEDTMLPGYARLHSSVQNLSHNFPLQVRVEDPGEKRYLLELDATADIMERSEIVVLDLDKQAASLYKTLRNNGLIVETLGKAALAAVKRWPIRAGKVVTGYGTERWDENYSCLITKTMWMDAIRTVITIHQADNIETGISAFDKLTQDELVTGNDKMLCLMYLHVFGVMCHLCEARKTEQELSSIRKELSATKKKVEANRETVQIKKLKEKLSEQEAREERRLAAACEKLKTAIDDHSVSEAKMTQQIQRLEEELAIYRMVETQGEAVDDIITDDTDLVELPETDVMFIGGHPNLVAKLRAAHRGWKFVSSVLEIPKQVTYSYVFCYSRQISHKLWYTLQSHFDGTILYCEGTNLDKLHDSMRRTLTAFQCQSIT